MTKDELDYLGIERWTTCPGVPACRISTFGRIRSSTGKIVAQHVKDDGYVIVRLWCPERKITTPSQRVHRLVAMAFLPNPDELPEVHHKDSDPANNRALNLEWVTRLQNEAYKYEDGPDDDYRKWLEQGAQI